MILNKKSITNQDSQIFKAELEKFRPHQNRILQANHKQTSFLKELTRSYDALLQDKRVRSEQSKYEAFSRQRSSVMTKYRKVNRAFNDLVTGLMRAQGFYSGMKETVESLHKNVETFVNNRRSEGGQLLSGIEALRKQHDSSTGGLVDWERERLKELMDRMSMDPTTHSASTSSPSKTSPPTTRPPYSALTSSTPTSPPVSTQYASPLSSQYPSQYTPGPLTGMSSGTSYLPRGGGNSNGTAAPTPRDFTYQPTNFGPLSPPAHQHPAARPSGPASHHHSLQYSHQPYSGVQRHSDSGATSGSGNVPPPGWQPPPPPPGPPPAGAADGHGAFGLSAQQGDRYPAGPGGYAAPPRQGSAGGGNPWGGLGDWR